MVESSQVGENPYAHLNQKLDVDGKEYNYFNLQGLENENTNKLPFSIRVLLESAVRNCDNFHIHSKSR